MNWCLVTMDPKKRFLTTYKKDYIPRKAEPRKSYSRQQQFKDPVNESFRHYLKLKGVKINPKEKEEYVENYLEKFKKLYPKLGRIYFAQPIIVPTIERSFLMDGQTIYRADYCDSTKDKASEREESDATGEKTSALPPNWVLPQTTNNQSYRDPRDLEPDALRVVEPVKPTRGSWGASSEVADIMQVITGKSEYGAIISALGDVIIKDQIHGKIVHPKCNCTLHNRPKKGD